MAPTILNSTIILNESLRLFRTKCKALHAVNRDYDKRFGDNASLKPGTTLYARKPIQVTIRDGKKRNVQDTVEEKIPVTCTTQFGVDLPAFTSEQKTMNIDNFSKLYLEPVMSRMASELDRLILQHAALNFHQYVGTAGTTPATATVLLQAGQKLTEMNCPDDDRFCILNPAANTAIVNAVTGFYNPSSIIDEQYKTGYLQSSLGLKVAVSNNIHRVTQGSRTGSAILVDEPSGTNLIEGMEMVHIDGIGSTTTIKKGEKFTISGVYSVTPETKINTGSLQQFTVTADAVGATTECDLYFSPAIRATGARQNVNALPVDGTDAGNGELTFAGTTASTAYPYNIIMHKDALTLVTADLPLPKGVNEARRDVLDGISMRYIEDYDGTNDEFFSRWDIFYGISTLYDYLGVVLLG
ncbi:MAG: P22 phage major capsid protein family protein [Candidatus Marinimicrobia bacterium]|nr:P22 phage major capsid protein family protein [Candidatus Neomarinimicrobiota bacterium]